jgi:acetyltransferase-like isoleucine patch superfamily enzyme
MEKGTKGMIAMFRAKRWSNFLRLPLYGKFQKLSIAAARVKTMLFYRWIFGSMGRGCMIGRPLLLGNPHFMHLGQRVIIRHGARLEAINPFPHRRPELRIGNSVSIEQNAHIVCQSRIYIGDRVSISANCCILDTTHPFDDPENNEPIVTRLRDEDSFVLIGEGSLIGYGSVILPNVRIGKYAVIGALTVVDRDVPDYGIVRGNPARLLQVYQTK